MDSSLITQHLYRKFDKEKYQLSNAFVYSWESDFYYKNKSGYSNEVEIKTSLNDFRADFKKIAKHNHLRAVFKGEKTYVQDYRLEYKVSRKKYDRRKEIWEEYNHISRQSNRSTESWWKKNGYEFEQISTEIMINETGKVPNKLWYISPNGVIPITEVPEYAGLYYIAETGRITVQKRAPFITKEIFNLDSELLQKFYYICRDYRFKEQQL